MDTKLNPNGPRTDEFPPEESSRKDTPFKKRRKVRGKCKWAGFVILGVSLLLITLGTMCQINARNATRYGGVSLYGAYDTQIDFVYYHTGREVVYGLENLISKLLILADPASQATDTSYSSAYSSEIILSEEAAALYAAVTQGENLSSQPPNILSSDDETPVTVVVPESSPAPASQSSYQIQGSEIVEHYAQLMEQIRLREQLLNEKGYLFYLTLADGTVFSNFPVGETLESLRTSACLVLTLNRPSSNTFYFDMDLNAVAEQLNRWGVHGEVFLLANGYDEWTYAQDLIYENDYTRTMLREQQRTGQASMIIGWGLLLFGFVFQRKNMLSAISSLYFLYLKQPLVMKLAGMFASFCLLVFNMAEIGLYYSYRIDLTRPEYILALILWTFIILYALLSLLYVVAAAPRLKQTLANEPDIRWLQKFTANMRSLLRTRNYGLIAFAVIGMVVFLGLILLGLVGFAFIIDQEVGVGLLCWLGAGVGGLVVSAAFSLLLAYTRMIVYTENIMHGDYHPFVVGKGWFTKPLQNLENISEGMRIAVAEAVKSERMKTELITNVSHDLKTPLTSIINYIALLKETSFAQERTASEYVEVIERKTQRLNVLIEDLFEASRLNSGAVELQPEDVNAVELLKQSLGELSEKIDASGIHFIEQYSTERIILYVDGKKIWRVFENLVGNILKYAPAGSRAYIQAEEMDGEAVLTFKNVSNYALDMPPEELFERFKRGDSSRTTEGSGLGLSIARSIVEHSGGQLQIVTDGDLFKALVRFPLAHS